VFAFSFLGFLDGRAVQNWELGYDLKILFSWKPEYIRGIEVQICLEPCEIETKFLSRPEAKRVRDWV